MLYDLNKTSSRLKQIDSTSQIYYLELHCQGGHYKDTVNLHECRVLKLVQN